MPTKTYVNTSVVRVIEDNLIADIPKTAPIEAIARRDSIAETLIDKSLKSLAITSNIAFEKAKRGDYYLGLPNHSFLTNIAGRQETIDYLENLHGTTVALDYYLVDELHYLHVAFENLHENYQYNETTNEIIALSDIYGEATYLENLVGYYSTVTEGDTPFVYPDSTTLESLESPAPNARPTPWTNIYASTDQWEFIDTPTPTVRANIAYGTPQTRSSIDLGLMGYNIESTYAMAKYSYDPGGGLITGYFTYEIGSNTIVNLEEALATISTPEFMPFAFFIEGRQDLTDPSKYGTNRYKDTKELLRIMNLNFDDLGQTIQENPDINDVDTAVLFFGVPLTGQDDIELEYLYLFFDWLELNQSTITADKKTVVISDSTFRVQINWNNLVATNKTGVLQNDKTYESELTTITVTENVIINGSSTNVDRQEIVWVIRKQIGGNTYREIQIDDVEMLYRVGGKNVYISEAQADNRLLIPINHVLCLEHFNLYDRDKLYNRSMHIVFNSLVTQNLSWYETELFRIILVIAAVAITIFSGGAGSVANQFAVLAATNGVIAAAFLIGLEILVVSVLSTEVFSYIAKEIGGDATLILAAVLAISAVYGNFNSANTANYLLQSSVNLTNASAQGYQAEINEYIEEAQAFATYADDKLDELADIQRELGLGSEFNLYELIGMIPFYVEGEKPDEFFNRTINNNVGVEVYNLMHNYVDNKLKLPTVNDLNKQFKRI